MAWPGTGCATWSSATLNGSPLGQSIGTPDMSHDKQAHVHIRHGDIGFDKPADTDATATGSIVVG
jgi:hypothetical protein